MNKEDFWNDLNNIIYTKSVNKDFKIGDFVYTENTDDFFGNKYMVGKIDSFAKTNKNIICIIGFLTDALPISKEKYINQFKYETIRMMNNVDKNKVYRLRFIEEYKQEIVDKLEVLTTLIDLYLDIKNEKAFNACVKEYKELEYKLNKSEVLV